MAWFDEDSKERERGILGEGGRLFLWVSKEFLSAKRSPVISS